GNRSPAGASRRRRLRRYRRHAHGHRGRDPRDRAVRTHGRAIRVLPLPRARCRARAGAAVPPLLGNGHRDVPARPSPLPPRHRRRLQALETRLASLALPAPLKRALTAARDHLEPATPGAAALVLSQLIAPAREVLGPEAGDAVAVAARAARIHL